MAVLSAAVGRIKGRSVVEGALSTRFPQPPSPFTTPFRDAVPLPVPGRI